MHECTSQQILRHGQFQAPEVAVLGDTGAPEENAGGMTGVIKRFAKYERASEKPSALGCVSVAYRDAIQLQDAASSAQMRGLGIMFIVLAGGAYLWGLYQMYDGVMIELTHEDPSLYFFGVVAFGLWFMFFVARHWFVAAWHLDAFSAEDQPTVFDRKHRKVYRMFVNETDSRWIDKLKRKPLAMTTVEYDWDCITAEYRAELVTTGNSVSRIHRLVMVARDYPKPGEKQGRLLEEFNVGNSMALGENSTPMLWEHIRRFMEEDGPHLPEGEVAAPVERPKTLWQSIAVTSGPFGPKFGLWWSESPLGTITMLLGFPFTFPFFMLWSFFNWISHKLMRPIQWPGELTQRLGPPLPKA